MNIIQSLLKLFCLLNLAAFTANAQNIATNADALLNAYYKQDLFTGTVLIAKEGKIVFEKSYGKANREAGIANTSTTQYRIGSLSKPFTAMIVLQLMEKGLLQLHQPISKYFNHFPKGDSITIENLLNHTSGIKSITSTKQYRTHRAAIKGRAEVLQILQAEPLFFTPGSKYDYSNSNYILLSYIAEMVTGTQMKELVKDFATKLRLTNTAMDNDGRTASTRAMGYEAGAIKDYLPSVENNITMVTGAGGMYSTVQDLFKLDRALYTEKIVNNKTKEKMFTGGKGGYALGWETGSYKGRKEIGHSGSIEGFKTMMLRYPESGTSIIFLSNYWNTPGQEIIENLKAIAFNESFKLPEVKNYISLPTQQLKSFEGEYRFNNAMTMILKEENGILLSEIKGQPVVGFKPTSEVEFYNKSNDAALHFIKDASGLPTSFKLIKGRQVMEWTKK